jgi:hypothetical protein
MPSTDVELCMATLYTNAEARREFLRSPETVLDRFHLTDEERHGFLAIDRAGLVLAGNGFSAKRAKYNRWMHTLVKPVQQFDGLLEPGMLAAALETIAHASRTDDRAPDGPCELMKRVDFFEWEANSHHNREHMLSEADGLPALVNIWARLQATVLLNHHLLRCYAVSAGCAAKLSVHREYPRPGTYLTYICLAPDRNGRWAAETAIHYEDEREIMRTPFGEGRVTVIPADVLHCFALREESSKAGPLVLAFKSLAAIQ